MLNVLLYTFISVIIVSLVSFVGVLSLTLGQKSLDKILLILVSLSAGALFGDALIHLLPEAAQEGFTLSISLLAILGILTFFVLEKIIHWQHCHLPIQKHKGMQHVHRLGIINLVGDGLHNFIDGLIIAGSYLVSIPVGIATTIAVIFHEIPQEIADFGVLLYAGFSKGKALLFNFLSATIAVVGALIGYFIGAGSQGFLQGLLPFTAGGFLYIAGSNLIPELHKECDTQDSVLHFLSLIAGIGLMAALKFLE
ncbi:TPA: ZIP family metal transporter [Candidatus Woesearchaeota archaeon]|nr:ZIP family metal transporter [Candidatus Woesearchaeota archaeon]HIH13352.1 ZIP family metal transporter [Candidatus Woesearchaeota archaeon]